MQKNDKLLTFGEHLDLLRKLLFRIIGVVAFFSILIFCLKKQTFTLLLAPSECDFITYRIVENIINTFDANFKFEEFHVDLIATELSSQFITHITTSIYLGILLASPYMVYELFVFISPALYENEKKYSIPIFTTVYFLFIIGVLMSYYVIFPISFRFLGTYTVAERIHSTITLNSYISTFTTLTLVMGLVFQLPVVTFILGKMGILNAQMLVKYRKHALLLLMLLAAIITPPDIMTLVLVTIPLYMLFEISIQLLKFSISKNEV